MVVQGQMLSWVLFTGILTNFKTLRGNQGRLFQYQPYQNGIASLCYHFQRKSLWKTKGLISPTNLLTFTKTKRWVISLITLFHCENSICLFIRNLKLLKNVKRKRKRYPWFHFLNVVSEVILSRLTPDN